MDPDAELLLPFHLHLNDGAVGQVILQHHINPVAGGEGVLNMRDSGRAEAEFKRMGCHVELEQPMGGGFSARPEPANVLACRGRVAAAARLSTSKTRPG